MNHKIDFYCFSGTGNTLLVVKQMIGVFRERGEQVELKKLELSNPAQINKENILGLAFPVAYFSTYPFVWQFINNLPKTAGTKVFMVDTLGGFSGAFVGHLKNVLQNKGYIPIGAKEIQMSANLFYIYSEKLTQKITEKGLTAAKKYAEDILNGKSHWATFPLASFIYFLSGGFFLKIIHGRWNQTKFGLKVNQGKCNRCGICVKLCPEKNIIMEEFPVYGAKCSFCMRCVSWCPSQAIICNFNYKGKVYNASGIKVEDLI